MAFYPTGKFSLIGCAVVALVCFIQIRDVNRIEVRKDIHLNQGSPHYTFHASEFQCHFIMNRKMKGRYREAVTISKLSGAPVLPLRFPAGVFHMCKISRNETVKISWVK